MGSSRNDRSRLSTTSKMDSPQHSLSLVSKSPSRAIIACWSQEKDSLESFWYNSLVMHIFNGWKVQTKEKNIILNLPWHCRVFRRCWQSAVMRTFPRAASFWFHVFLPLNKKLETRFKDMVENVYLWHGDAARSFGKELHEANRTLLPVRGLVPSKCRIGWCFQSLGRCGTTRSWRRDTWQCRSVVHDNIPRHLEKSICQNFIGFFLNKFYQAIRNHIVGVCKALAWLPSGFLWIAADCLGSNSWQSWAALPSQLQRLGIPAACKSCGSVVDPWILF